MDERDARARLAEASDAIVTGVERALPGWVVARATDLADWWGGLDAAASAVLVAHARAAGAAAAARVGEELRALFATPPEAQRTTPLEVVRGATREVTSVLRTAGVPPVVRDGFDERAFPDDVYGVTPRTLSDLGDDDLGPWQLAWGMAKAQVLRAGRDGAPC
jgi:hypothetical protein